MLEHDVVVTLDTDWAPDFAIDRCARLLIEKSVPATWFITHSSPAISRLSEHPELFELGIHPNFMPGSTHGEHPEDVLAHCLKLVPNARSVRTHALLHSNHIAHLLMTRSEIDREVSTYLPHLPDLQAARLWSGGRSMHRIPFFWEDDLESERPTPSWWPEELLANGQGLKIFDFHPIHVFLNSRNNLPYERLKGRAPQLSEATPEQAGDLVAEGEGSGAMFQRLLDQISGTTRATRIDGLVLEQEPIAAREI